MIESQESADKRTEKRLAVDLLLNKYVRGRPYICRAENMSRRGFLLRRVFEPKQADADVGLQFQLPGTDRVITCAGRIVYGSRHDSAHGVTLTNVDPEHQQLIDDFLARKTA